MGLQYQNYQNGRQMMEEHSNIVSFRYEDKRQLLKEYAIGLSIHQILMY